MQSFRPVFADRSVKTALPSAMEDRMGVKTGMTRKEAERILLEKRPHSAECERNRTGLWDRSGKCERCTAFIERGKADV